MSVRHRARGYVVRCVHGSPSAAAIVVLRVPMRRLIRMRRVRMLCFFFQAEDGIRDLTVTGVQTCALPISFTYVPTGTGTSDSFTYCANGTVTGTTCSSGLTATVTLGAGTLGGITVHNRDRKSVV